MAANTERPGAFSRRRLLEATFATVGGAYAAGAVDAVTKSGAALAADTQPFAGKSIRYQQRDSSAEDFVRNIFAPRFAEETGCEVILEDIPQAELYAKAQVMAAAGQLGDLIFGFENPQMATWAAKGMLRPLDDLAAADDYDMSQYYPEVAAALLVDDKLYGLTTAGHPGIVNIYFNRAMMEENGVTPPDADFPHDSWAWDDMVANAAKLTKDTDGDGRIDVWGFIPAKFSPNWAYVHVRRFGGDLISADGRTAVAGSEQSQAAYRYLHDLTYKHKVSPTPADVPPNTNTEKFAGQYLATGQCGMFEDATILITSMERYAGDQLDWGVFPLPPGPAGTRGGTNSLNTTSVTGSSTEPEAAWEFLKLICSQEAGVQKLLTNSGSPGLRPDVFLDPRVTEKFPWFTVGHDVMLDSRRIHRPANNRASEVADATLQIEGEIWLDRISPEEGAQKLQEAIQEILDKPA